MSAHPQVLGDAVETTTGARPATAARPSRWRRDALRRRLLAGADLTAALGAAFVVGIVPGEPALLLLVPAIWVLVSKLHGLYDRDHRILRPLTVDEFPRLVSCVTMASAAVALTASAVLPQALTSGEAVRLWVTAMVTVPLLRAAARQLWRQVTPPEATLIVGHGPLAAVTRRKIDLFRDMHAEIAGIVPDDRLTGLTTENARARIAAHAGRDHVDRILVASPAIDEALIASLVHVCRADGIKLGVVPPARGMFGTAVQLDHVADLSIIQYNTWDIPRSTDMLKRAMDLFASALMLIVLAPVLAVIALLVRLDSRGPAFFVQRRAGRGGQTFPMVKFRTMSNDAEAQLEQLVKFDELVDPVFKLRADPRITRVGKLLRRWSLDELPQLINVVLGQMSLVGPRPEQVELVQLYRQEHRFRLAVRPGLTGPMQVYGRGELTFDERLAVERDYVENLSLGRDLRLLLLTAAAVLTGRGAY